MLVFPLVEQSGETCLELWIPVWTAESSKAKTEVSNSESRASLRHVTMDKPLVPHYVAL